MLVDVSPLVMLAAAFAPVRWIESAVNNVSAAEKELQRVTRAVEASLSIQTF